MGVRGLESFLEKHGHSRVVSIAEEIEKWKRRHSDKTPLIVFDIAGLCCLDDASLVGGNSNKFDDDLDRWLKRLKEMDTKLVFFSSLSHQTCKIESSIEQANENFEKLAKIYDKMGYENSTNVIMQRFASAKKTYSSLNLMSITLKYGKYDYGRLENDSDQDIANYATKKRAFAIFSLNTNFMIYNGFWKFWTYRNLDFDAFTAMEFDRLILNQELLLTFEQRPLLATLMGNDSNQRYHNELKRFYRKLNRSEPNENVSACAAYIRKLFKNRNLSEDNTERIAGIVAADVFGKQSDDTKRQWIIDSLKSFETNYKRENAIKDIICRKLQPTSLLRSYLNSGIDIIQHIKMPFINEICEGQSKLLNDLLTEMIRKQVGLINRSSDEQTFKMIAKKTFEGPYELFDETAISPDFDLGVLLTTRRNKKVTLYLMQWRVLGWLLSISDEQRMQLKQLDAQLRMPCATLMILKQIEFLTSKAAAGILITENEIRCNCNADASMPERLNLYYMNVAHVYKNMYRQVRKAFELAGLSGHISDTFKFDGVYYQKLMASKDMFEEKLSTLDQEFELYI